MLKLCKCGCGETIKPPRRVWVSDDCRLDWLSHNYMAWARPACGRRDGYVCQMCGIDCEALESELRHLYRRAIRGGYRRFGTMDAWNALLAELQLTPHEACNQLWQADHIIPQCEDGPDDVDNLRTLCLWCHKVESRKLAARRAEERRQARIALADQMPLFVH